MDDIFAVQMQVTFDKLAYIVEGLILLEFLLNFFTEIAIAKLGDNICVVLCIIDLV
jgi:hypothetical protein